MMIEQKQILALPTIAKVNAQHLAGLKFVARLELGGPAEESHGPRRGLLHEVVHNHFALFWECREGIMH